MGDIRSQGGVKFPTGGKQLELQARERLDGSAIQGQQIWCKSRADGHSPDERET